MTTKEAKEFFEALDFMAEEKEIDPQYLAEKVRNAILLAVRKQFDGVENIQVEMDPEKSKVKVCVLKEVVEEVNDPCNEILLEAALTHSKRARVGKPVEIKVDSKHIGRIAAQAAKQQIRQGLKEAEREQMASRMGDKVGEVITVRVEQTDPISGNTVVKIDDNQVILFKSEQLPGDTLEAGDLIKVYAADISSNDRRCTLKISRTHPNLVRRLFELEVPDIYNGQVEIKSIAREAGFRTKISVAGKDEDLDPVGACIGAKGARVNAIVEELGGEKIDIIKYSDDPAEYIAGALSPAKVVEVEIVEDEENDERVAFVSVPDSQLSLAIGNRGQNAKLAARITGFKIDISPESGFYGEDKKSSLKDKIERRLLEKQEKLNLKEQESKALEDEMAEVSDIDETEEFDMLACDVEQMLQEKELAKD